MIYPFEWDNPEHVDLMYDVLVEEGVHAVDVVNGEKIYTLVDGDREGEIRVWRELPQLMEALLRRRQPH